MSVQLFVNNQSLFISKLNQAQTVSTVRITSVVAKVLNQDVSLPILIESVFKEKLKLST
ncbi:hypothetical protein ACFLY2_03325 [Patescibacteria group bacterium]